MTGHLVRLSMLISPARQSLCSATRSKGTLGLATHKVFVPRASHASNGMAERAVATIRSNAMTLKSHLESRIKAAVEGLKHVYSWLMRHSSFLFNCFGVCVRGAPPFEVVYGRRFRAKMVPFGELVLFHRASKHRGELQWLRCVAWAQ